MTNERTGRYDKELTVVQEAVLEAGERLREVFLAPGGLPGVAGNCPLDREVEARLRARLREAFPTYGQIGEEQKAENAVPQDPDRHLFAIDPHDGTASALRGWRGSTVSVGLLRAGQPVLGVVYAYAARAGHGDLFAWAEGGDLVRNGQKVGPRPVSPDESIVMVSQDADKKPVINARLCAPARFRAVASIAYRLALVAAGEGQVGVSASGSAVWDVAAGHALLRGVGYRLFRDGGAPVRYDPGGKTTVGVCFGGDPSFAGELAGRDWSAVFGSAELSPTCYPLAFPRKEAVCRDVGVLDRARGCLVGQLAGDSLGGLVEFKTAAAIEECHPGGPRDLQDGGTWDLIAGQPTDDSELALLLARSILKAGEYEPKKAARAYAWWVRSRPFDMGATIGNALRAAARAVEEGEDPARAAEQAAQNRLDSQANGALMRIAPLAIWGHDCDEATLASMARADARLTHAHPICQDANAVFVVALGRAIREGLGPRELYDGVLAWAKEKRIRKEVRGWLEEAEDQPPGEFHYQMGWVRIAFQNAFYCLLHATGSRDALSRTVAAGGDTDTNAAIAGALWGSVHGQSAMPQQWLERLLCCRPIEGQTSSSHPRPTPFWPVDCLILAERLVTL